MSHADFSEKVNGQTKADADRQTKKLEQRQRHGIPLLASQEGIKLHTNCVRDMWLFSDFNYGFMVSGFFIQLQIL